MDSGEGELVKMCKHFAAMHHVIRLESNEFIPLPVASIQGCTMPPSQLKHPGHVSAHYLKLIDKGTL